MFDEASGTWFLGDLLFVGHVPTLDGSLKGWLALMEALTARGTTRVVPGHGPASVAWPMAAGDERRYLDLVQSDVRRLIAEGQPMSVAPDRRCTIGAGKVGTFRRIQPAKRHRRLPRI